MTATTARTGAVLSHLAALLPHLAPDDLLDPRRVEQWSIVLGQFIDTDDLGEFTAGLITLADTWDADHFPGPGSVSTHLHDRRKAHECRAAVALARAALTTGAPA